MPTALAETMAAGPDFEVVARIFVCPTDDAGYARALGRRMIAAYLTVPAYAEFHRWLGREPVLGAMWQAWAAGDRKGALAAIPDELVDELIVHGSPPSAAPRCGRTSTPGSHVPVMALLPTPGTGEGRRGRTHHDVGALGRSNRRDQNRTVAKAPAGTKPQRAYTRRAGVL